MFRPLKWEVKKKITSAVNSFSPQNFKFFSQVIIFGRGLFAIQKHALGFLLIVIFANFQDTKMECPEEINCFSNSSYSLAIFSRLFDNLKINEIQHD